MRARRALPAFGPAHDTVTRSQKWKQPWWWMRVGVTRIRRAGCRNWASLYPRKPALRPNPDTQPEYTRFQKALKRPGKPSIFNHPRRTLSVAPSSWPWKEIAGMLPCAAWLVIILL